MQNTELQISLLINQLPVISYQFFMIAAYC